MGNVRKIKSGKILKLNLHTKGYYCLTLFNNSKQFPFLIHHLVIEAFKGPRPTGYDIHHVDGNRLNNDCINLIYISKSDHNKIHYKYHPVKVVCSYGSAHGRSKLSEKEVIEIRTKYIKRIYSLNKLASEYNVCINTIHTIIKRVTWKHI